MILQRYILRELVLAFLFSFAVVMAVFFVGLMFQAFRTYEGLGFDLLVRAAPQAAGSASSWALLLATCPTITVVYGRMAAENEIDAMRMSGVPTGRVVAPALLLGLGLSAMGYVINEYVSPAAHYGRRLAVRESILLVLKIPPPGVQRFPIGPYRLSYVDYQNGRMIKPYLRKLDGAGNVEFECQATWGVAVVAEGKPPRLVMYQCEVTRDAGQGRKETLRFESEFPIDLEIEDIARAEKRPDDMREGELWSYLARTSQRHKRGAILTEIHTRYAKSLSPLYLVLVALPIGVFVKRGSRLAGLGASLPPLILYFIAYFVFQGMGDKGRAHPVVAAYAPGAIMALLAAGLLWRMYRR